MLTDDEENANNTSSKAKWTRKHARGILTPKERKFLQGEIKPGRNMVRYFRSNIFRKTRKALEDLDLIFKACQVWRIFIDEWQIVDNLVKEAVELQYDKNCLNEFRHRRKRKVKRRINKGVIIERTREQLNEIIDSILDDLRTKEP